MEAALTRSESGIVFRDESGADVRGTLVRLSRQTIVFEVYSPYPVVETGQSLNSLTVYRDGVAIYSGGAVVDGVLRTGLVVIVTATPIGSWAGGGMELPPGWQADSGVLLRELEDDQSLIPDYQIAVSNLHSFLDRLSRWAAPFDLVCGDSQEEAERVAEDLFPRVRPRLLELVDRWEDAWALVSAEQTGAHRRFAQRQLHPLMLCAPFIHRTYSKPLGYAGDYEMVNMLLRNRMEGPSTYARIINSLVLRMDPGQAHRNRIDRLVECFAEEVRRVAPEGRPLRVMNLGCGPCSEVERFLRTAPESADVEMTLLDFNQETIEYARARLDRAARETGRNPKIRFLQMSINDVLREAVKRRSANLWGDYDLVYCAGLFDYMSDRICSRLIELMHAWTVPGGRVVTTNVHPRHRIHALMEDVLEWHLILRTEQEMLSLAAPELGRREVSTEATGVNVFLDIRRPR